MIRQLLRQGAHTLVAICALAALAAAQVQSDVQLNQNVQFNPLLGAPTVSITSTAVLGGRDRPAQTAGWRSANRAGHAQRQRDPQRPDFGGRERN